MQDWPPNGMHSTLTIGSAAEAHQVQWNQALFRPLRLCAVKVARTLLRVTNLLSLQAFYVVLKIDKLPNLKSC
jgi:hypothetical protein